MYRRFIPMISVIIPTFNEEENIAQCLVSLTHQTVPRTEYEIIVVDGGSKDDTCGIAGKYADKVFSQTSKKVGGARNDGIMEAKGEIVATTDADCILPPNWIELIKTDFQDQNLVQLYGPVYPIEVGFGNKVSLLLANTSVSYTHLRAHETDSYLVCRLLLEKKK